MIVVSNHFQSPNLTKICNIIHDFNLHAAYFAVQLLIIVWHFG